MLTNNLFEKAYDGLLTQFRGEVENAFYLTKGTINNILQRMNLKLFAEAQRQEALYGSKTMAVTIPNIAVFVAIKVLKYAMEVKAEEVNIMGILRCYPFDVADAAWFIILTEIKKMEVGN